VAQLGTRAPVPVEVIRFARRPVADYLASLGARVVLRERDGQAFITDEGNVILDCHFPGLPDPQQTARLIRAQPGVVEHGLFLGMARVAVIAGERGVTVLEA
jgi:ribose 5-phosphate isomerase A